MATTIANYLEKRKKLNKRNYKKAEKLMNEALKWVTCPLGDCQHKIRNFEIFLFDFENTQIGKHFDKLFFEESNKLHEAYHTPDENGFSAYDMDQAMMYH